jgi:hypothetical protein
VHAVAAVDGSGTPTLPTSPRAAPRRTHLVPFVDASAIGSALALFAGAVDTAGPSDELEERFTICQTTTSAVRTPSPSTRPTCGRPVLIVIGRMRCASLDNRPSCGRVRHRPADRSKGGRVVLNQIAGFEELDRREKGN